MERKEGCGEYSKHREESVHLQDIPKRQKGQSPPPEESEGLLEKRLREMRTVNRSSERWLVSGSALGFLRPDMTGRNMCKG